MKGKPQAGESKGGKTGSSWKRIKKGKGSIKKKRNTPSPSPPPPSSSSTTNATTTTTESSFSSVNKASRRERAELMRKWRTVGNLETMSQQSSHLSNIQDDLQHVQERINVLSTQLSVSASPTASPQPTVATSSPPPPQKTAPAKTGGRANHVASDSLSMLSVSLAKLREVTPRKVPVAKCHPVTAIPPKPVGAPPKPKYPVAPSNQPAATRLTTKAMTMNDDLNDLKDLLGNDESSSFMDSLLSNEGKSTKDSSLDDLTAALSTSSAKDSSLDDLTAALNATTSNKDTSFDDLAAALNTATSSTKDSLDDLTAALNTSNAKDSSLDDLTAALNTATTKDSSFDDLTAALNTSSTKDSFDDLTAALNTATSSTKDSFDDLTAALNTATTKDSSFDDLTAALNATTSNNDTSFDDLTAALNATTSSTIESSITTASDLSAALNGLDFPSLDAKTNLAASRSSSSSSSSSDDDDDNNSETAALVKEFSVSEDMNEAGLRRGKKAPVITADRKKRYQMEDMHAAKYPLYDNATQAFFGVFDGFGGLEASKAASKIVPRITSKVIEKNGAGTNLAKHWELIFAQSDKKMAQYEFMGTTCTAALVWSYEGARYLQAANVGDSNAFLCRASGEVVPLTREHKVRSESERERLKAAGKTITEKQTRINGVSVARALGASFLKENATGVIATPDVSESYRLTKEDKLLIIASDGVWDVMSGKEAYDMVKDEPSAKVMADKLIKYAVASRACVDNVTALVVRL